VKLSTQEHIYIDARESPAQLADQLAPLIGATVVHGDHGDVYLSRPARDGVGSVGGEIYSNDAADSDAGIDDESFLDSFPVVLDVGYTGRDRDIQFREATDLFVELAAKVPLRMALVRGYDFLIAVSSPITGLVWLPEETTPYAPDRARWLPFRS
jgi:hypothetical protein